jgi:hypothetical protein
MIGVNVVFNTRGVQSLTRRHTLSSLEKVEGLIGDLRVLHCDFQDLCRQRSLSGSGLRHLGGKILSG